MVHLRKDIHFIRKEKMSISVPWFWRRISSLSFIQGKLINRCVPLKIKAAASRR